jgi:hypothetical protein
MRFVCLQHPYTLNGVVRWVENVPHEATDELRQLLADGVAGVEHGDDEPAADQAETAPQA